ncbi:MAG: transporter substrate-binding domain-containing protein, partial [Gammaproteobacteria bacterium]|nr:transporter substrate-binding domain-containing protein [Gammaproteobacteria bacterium]
MLNRSVTLVKFFLLVISSSFLCEIVQAEQLVGVAEELTVVIPAKYPPYYVINEKNKPDGFAINVFEEVASRLGLRFRYEIKPGWTGVCNALKNGSADIVPLMGLTTEREEYALFTSAVETFPVSIFVRNSNVDINNPKDLDNQKVAVVLDECENHVLADHEKVYVKKFNQF